ncbi:hypothetical protein WJX74_000801 [Apatococcus lobatus]|uniref:Uncharacterized protein n=1 Tax=Apatococcus lobatus TaxID=904363 RepID=A0AAW1Q5F1_9CHLO
MHHHRPSRARIAELPAPCLVARLIDWVYDNILKHTPSNRDEAGVRVLDKKVHLRAFVGDRELYPWNHVATGAWVVFKRLPFTEELYEPPAWHPTSVWDRMHLTDDYIIKSFIAHQEYAWLLEQDLRRSHVAQRAKVAEALGRPVAKPRRRIVGISMNCLKTAETPEEIDRAFQDNFGRLVVPRADHDAFRRHVAPPPPHAPVPPAARAPPTPTPAPSADRPPEIMSVVLCAMGPRERKKNKTLPDHLVREIARISYSRPPTDGWTAREDNVAAARAWRLVSKAARHDTDEYLNSVDLSRADEEHGNHDRVTLSPAYRMREVRTGREDARDPLVTLGDLRAGDEIKVGPHWKTVVEPVLSRGRIVYEQPSADDTGTVRRTSTRKSTRIIKKRPNEDDIVYEDQGPPSGSLRPKQRTASRKRKTTKSIRGTSNRKRRVGTSRKRRARPRS